MSRFTNRQVIVLCALSMGFGALFSPPLKSVAQPPEASANSEGQPSQTPQPLATPPVAEIPTTGRSTRAIGPISGQGTAGYISKFTGPNAIGNSVLFENGGKIGLGTTTPAGMFGANSTVTNVHGINGVHTGQGTGVYGNSAGGNGVLGDSISGAGVRGRHTLSSGTAPGVSGETSSTSADASGVQGIVYSTAPGPNSAGVRGINNSTNSTGAGVYGSHAGSGAGVYGIAPNGYGVYGSSSSRQGIYGSSSSSNGVYGYSYTGNAVYGFSSSRYGVYGYSANYGGVGGESVGGTGVTGISSGGYGMRAISTNNNGISGESNKGSGVYGQSSSHIGVYGTAPNNYGVYGYSSGYGGVGGQSNGGTGVTGISSGGYGMRAISSSNRGLSGESSTGVGVYGLGNVGVWGNANSTANSYAGYFQGNVSVIGKLTKSSGSFKIDHPVRPATEYLSHSFVESPDMMNVYNGNAKLNSKGEAVVILPSYFQALNREFRYQLTCIGAPALVYVAQEIRNNHFKIAGGKAGMKVSWQVTGIRNDAYARQHRIRVEESKIGADRGKYLYPAGFGAGKDKQIGANSPRLASR